MRDFTYHNPTRIIFGKGRAQEVGVETARVAKRVLLHFGGGSIHASGLYRTVTASLQAAEVTVTELGGVKPNPRLSLVREGIRLCREQDIDLILAVGGGSVIDSAKAIAVGVPYAGDVWDFYTGQAQPKQALPVATILTIPAAGSESSDASVITNEDGNLKRAFGSSLIYPLFSILDPSLAFTLPPYQVACGISDMFAHALERYFTNTTHVALTDRLLEATMRTIITEGEKVLANPADYDTWAEVMWAGTVVHNNLLDTGRESDWASHMIEHELSGVYDIAHGAGLAIVFPAWMKHVHTHDKARFVQWAIRVWGVEDDMFAPDAVIKEGIARYERFLKRIGMPTRLSDINIGADAFQAMADSCTGGGTVGRFMKLTSDDVRTIYELAE